MPKITKADMIEALNEHFAKTGKQIANSSKLKVDDLKALCVKYNIDMNKGIEDREKAKIEAKKKKLEEIEANEKGRIEMNEKWQKEHDERLEQKKVDTEEYNNFSDDVKKKLLDMYLEYNENDPRINYYENKLLNEKVIADVDKMEAKYKAEGVRLVERQGKNVLQVGGIIIHHDYIRDEEFDIEKETKAYYDDETYRFKKFLVKYEKRFNVKVVIIGNDEIEIF